MNSPGVIKLMMTSALPVTQMTSRLAVLSKRPLALLCEPSLRSKQREVSQQRAAKIATAVNTTFSTNLAVKSRLLC